MTLKLGDQNCGKKIIFNFEFCIKTVKYVSVYKNIFMHPESQRNLLPVQFSQEVTGRCVLPDKELNQERERHRIQKNRIQYRREAKRVPSAGTAVCRFRKSNQSG